MSNPIVEELERRFLPTFREASGVGWRGQRLTLGGLDLTAESSSKEIGRRAELLA